MYKRQIIKSKNETYFCLKQSQYFLSALYTTVSQLKSITGSVHTINANIATSSRVMIPDARNTSVPDSSHP